MSGLILHARYRPNRGRFADIGSRKKFGGTVGTPLRLARAYTCVRLVFKKCPKCPNSRQRPGQEAKSMGHLRKPRCKPSKKSPGQRLVVWYPFPPRTLCTGRVDRGTAVSCMFCRRRVRGSSGSQRKGALQSIPGRDGVDLNPCVRRVALEAAVGGELPDASGFPADAHPGRSGLGCDQVLPL